MLSCWWAHLLCMHFDLRAWENLAGLQEKYILAVHGRKAIGIRRGNQAVFPKLELAELDDKPLNVQRENDLKALLKLCTTGKVNA